MDFRLKDKLELNGINVEKGLERYLNSEEAYFIALKSFVKENLVNDFIYYVDIDLNISMNSLVNCINRSQSLGLIDLKEILEGIRRGLRVGEVNKKEIESLRIKYNDLVEIINQI